MPLPQYKPLLYTTTMRNPERLKYMLYILSKYKGQILDDGLAISIVGETIRYGLYRPLRTTEAIRRKWETTPKGVFGEFLLTDSEVAEMIRMNPQKHKEAGFANGFPSRFATIFDLTKELGLAYYAPREKIEISQLGEHLLKAFNVSVDNGIISYEVDHPEYEQQVFLQAMAKSQRKNPFVRVLNDNIPLLLLLQTIMLLNSDKNQNGAGISRKEVPLLIFWKDNNARRLYERIVKLRNDFGYNPSDETVIDICIDEIMGGDYKGFKPKSITSDYTDEFLRKMRITGLISLRGGGRFVDINRNELQKVEYIIKQYSNYNHFTDEKEYFNYMASLDKKLIKIKSIPTGKNNAEKLLMNWLNQYAWPSIKKELILLSSGGASKDSVLKLISAPTRLEFLTALAIKSRIPNVRVLPNYSCDDEGLPTSTAGGNKGDIECYEHHKGILIEVTMATGRQQTIMEVWPIERHLEEFQKEIDAQCVFIAPSIFADSKRQIQFIKHDSDGKKEIRPYAISEFVNYLERTNWLYWSDDREESIAAEPSFD